MTVGSELTDVKAVFFDLDETLIDALAGLRAAHKAVAKKLRGYFPEELSDRSVEDLRRKLLNLDDEMNLQTNYDRDQWWPRFLEELDLDSELGSPRIKELTRTYWETYIRAAKPYEGTKSTLEYLKERNFTVGVITDTDSSGTSKRHRISELNFADSLDVVVVGGEDTEQSKPSPEPFRLASSRLNLGPSECVMVGDKPFTDIKGARSAGMKTILVKRREWGKDWEPDFVVNSLEELRNLF